MYDKTPVILNEDTVTVSKITNVDQNTVCLEYYYPDGKFEIQTGPFDQTSEGTQQKKDIEEFIRRIWAKYGPMNSHDTLYNIGFDNKLAIHMEIKGETL